jgi:ribosomal-protein-alanine N-acetyltransferase
MSGCEVARTARLVVRELTADDAAFILALLNDPDWLANIGDRKVRTEEDARKYIAAGPAAMIAQHGFGLWAVARIDDAAPIGMCGLIRRTTLEDVDIGFAFLPAFRGRGYAAEAAAASVDVARTRFGLRRLVGIVSPSNAASIRLLEKLGMTYERTLELTPGDPVRLFGMAL